MLLTVKQVAERLQVSEACIRRWVLEKRIKYTKIGSLIRFESETIEKIAKEGLSNA